MSTTRHLVNRQRRLAAAQTGTKDAPARTKRQDPDRKPERERKPDGERKPARGRKPAAERRTRPLPWLSILAALTILLGAFAAWAFTEAGSLRDTSSTANDALTDNARTSEVKGTVTKAVDAVFSYDHTKPEKTDAAARTYLTGKATAQHRELLAQVKSQGQKQKLVLTTTVTYLGIQRLEGDRAQALVYADQTNTSTAKGGDTSSSAAMFSVSAKRQGGAWKIANIDTFDR
ncbi:hypothetical protein [Streptomyces boninensis]|uniref:hypothetical protein n=1 Tax=Streptomyces boninensis TaxID=2039455 RepID=UPI003B20FB6C